MREGWEIKDLSIVAKVGAGNSAPQNKEFFENGIYPFFRTSDVGIIKLGSLTKSRDLINDDAILKMKLQTSGTILLPKSGASTFLNHRVILKTNGYVSSHLATVKADNELLLDSFLFYFLINIKAQDLIQDHAYPSLKLSDIKSIQTPTPPLQEQKEIVSILDDAFASIDKAKANIERNIKNAKELFKSKFKNLFSKKDESWIEFTLLELLDKNWIISHLDGNHGGAYPRKNEFVESGVPYISANCIKKGYVDFNKAKYLSQERAAKLRKGIAKNNDVLFAHNATVGPTALLKTNAPKVILGTSLTYYRCNENYINPKYLLLYLRSKEFTSQYESIMRQSTRNQVPITKQRTFAHIIPPLKVQNEIIPKLERLNENVEKIIEAYAKKNLRLEELKKSILQKAFSGELTNKTVAA